MDRAKKFVLFLTISILYVFILFRIGLIFFANQYYVRALHLEEEGNWRKAISLYEKAIWVYPKNVAFYEKLGRLYVYRSWFPGDATGFLNKAKGTLENGLALCPQDGELWLSLGMVWEGLLNQEEALASYNKALALDPQNAFYHAMLARFYFKSGREKEGVKAAREAIFCRPADRPGVDNYLRKMGISEELLKKIHEGIPSGD